MHNFTPISASIGGAMIGISTVIIMLFLGRVTGISGMIGNVLTNKPSVSAWRISFLGGFIVAGLFFLNFYPQALPKTLPVPTYLLIIAGLLVGFGTRMGNGCTSGHGVSGVARLSIRSIVATLTFLGTAVVTVYVSHHFLG